MENKIEAGRQGLQTGYIVLYKILAVRNNIHLQIGADVLVILLTLNF